MNPKDESKVAGGIARAKALTKEERSMIAKKAADSRWSTDLPATAYEGDFKIGDASISCAVLPNGARIITQAAFLRAIGRSRSPKAKTGVLSTVDDLPFFLSAKALKPFISEDLEQSTTPIFYKSENGGKGVGYDARLLPMVADVYLKFRDHCLETKGEVPKNYEHIIKASDILIRGLANVGIIALVDEATGYQRDRASSALAEILEQFIAKELQAWVKTFPDEYYEQMFRLRGLSFPKETVKKPQYFGHLTNDVIYKRLAPAVLEELKHSTPKDSKGRRKHKFFQMLTPELGHPKLREHMSSVITIMKLSDHYDDFKEKLDRVHPPYNETYQIDFDYKSENGL
jgi:P63C domain-containing protein